MLPALIVVSLILSASPVAHAQENVFTVSPGEFTARDAPPMGSPYTLAQVLVVWNRDNIPRTFLITVEVPPESAVRPGYEPIPNENWVIPYPSQILIPENSYAEVQISLNIPRWENLTSKKWEVWIPVERQAIPPENALEDIVRLKIETTAELPPGSKSTTSLTISEENFALLTSKSKILTVTLASDGNPVNGEDITWSATAGTIAPSSGKTNTLGQVTVVYTAPSYETSVIVSASYAGSGQYEPSGTSSYGTITASSSEPEPSAGISMGLIIGIAIVIGCAIIGAAILLARRRWRAKGFMTHRGVLNITVIVNWG